MKQTVFGRSAAIALLLAFPGTVAFTQDVAYQYESAPAVYAPSQAELDQILAPVALYPDALLGDILAASTYPLEVIQLARWLERNPGLSGAELEQAVAQQPWDPSVKSLAPFRDMVRMMNGELDWMQRLGNAFLADQGAVMDGVQRLRRKARDNGSLADNEHERVADDRTVITIEPAQPGVVYVPYYDPALVYGPWWWPAYPPYAWGPYYSGPWDYSWAGIAFGGVWVSGGWDHHHAHPDWHGHHLVDHDHHAGAPRQAWHHDPSHRIGVPYADNRQSERYRPSNRSSVQERQGYRGFDVRPGTQPQRNPVGRYATPSGRQPQTGQSQFARQQPHALQPVPSPIARQQSARGYESLASRPGNPVARAPTGAGTSYAPSGGGAHGSSGGSTAHGGGGGKR